MNFYEVAEELYQRNLKHLPNDDKRLKLLQHMFQHEMYAHLFMKEDTNEVVIPMDWVLQIDRDDEVGGVSLRFEVKCLNVGAIDVKVGSEVVTKDCELLIKRTIMHDKLELHAWFHDCLFEKYVNLVRAQYAKMRHPADMFIEPHFHLLPDDKALVKVTFTERLYKGES